jgi:glycosyltransferase EpsE
LPLVSVLMTTYKDDPARLGRAIDSILGQTLRDIELIVVFEAGDANFERFGGAYSDPRLVLARSDTAKGKTACFNVGLERAQGRYIARMDADDFAYAERLTKQVEFLRRNPEIALVGAAGRLLDHRGQIVGVRQFPTTHDRIVRSFVLTNPIFHPTVVWDRDRVGRDLRYDERFSVEDLELWLRLLGRGHRIANLPEVLLDYTQPENYTRPMWNWRGNLRVRVARWRVGMTYPLLFAGIGLMASLALMPRPIVDKVTGRNHLSDRLRSIRTAGGP